jgi:hypothetical protein
MHVNLFEFIFGPASFPPIWSLGPENQLFSPSRLAYEAVSEPISMLLFGTGLLGLGGFVRRKFRK